MGTDVHKPRAKARGLSASSLEPSSHRPPGDGRRLTSQNLTHCGGRARYFGVTVHPSLVRTLHIKLAAMTVADLPQDLIGCSGLYNSPDPLLRR